MKTFLNLIFIKRELKLLQQLDFRKKKKELNKFLVLKYDCMSQEMFT